LRLTCLALAFALPLLLLYRFEYAHDEDADSHKGGVVSASAVTMPQSLVGMSDDEMSVLAKSSLRKTDLLVMVRLHSLSLSFYLATLAQSFSH
jgi:hypothetical protein